MASNASSRKLSSKQLKMEMPQTTRVFRPQSTIVSINAKDANKDSKDRGRKLRSTTQKSISHTKQRSKRTEITEPLNRAAQPTATAPTPPPPPQPQTAAAPPAVAAAAQPSAAVKSISSKAPSNERTAILARHFEMAQHMKLSRKTKHDSAATMARAEDILLSSNTRYPKESKSPDRAETTAAAVAVSAQRPIRTKNQSHNSKVFFDKYFKFAYDLTQPDGVRQLEAHFFPTETYQSKQHLQKCDAGDSPEK